MTIRARLTVWYLTVVVAILIAGAVAASLAQRRFGLDRLDAELSRTMSTLIGVMTTELREGLAPKEAAAATSREVTAPGHSLALLSTDATSLAVWGDEVDPAVVSQAQALAAPTTLDSHFGPIRIMRRVVDDGPGDPFVAVTMALQRDLETQHSEMVKAMAIGAGIALLATGLGGWLLAFQALKPLSIMAQQAQRVNAQEPRERLTVSRANDEIGHVAAAFNGLLDRLSESLDQQRQFMADASHELRTPVSVIHTAAQVILGNTGRRARGDERTKDEYRESLTIVAEQARRLARMVDAMFLLSRAEARGVPLHRVFVNLDEIVAETARGLGVLAAQRGVTLTVTGVQEVGLLADDALLRQLVGNLFDNAIRHGGPHTEVTAHIERRGSEVVLRIQNDGEPIPSADRSRIFQRFVRVGESNGAGLGLPIARWIAEAHGGHLALETSEPGQTVFAVTLPAHPVPA